MYSLSKSERLCSKTLIEELLTSELSFVKYPFRIVLKDSSCLGEYPARMAISVSKKRFKRAVKRNRVKRLTREAYRLNKLEFYKNIAPGHTIDILFIYLDYNLPLYLKTEKAMKSALQKISTYFPSVS
ncbi:MAG: ribonuclease P protein component [Odoribacter sp.]